MDRSLTLRGARLAAALVGAGALASCVASTDATPYRAMPSAALSPALETPLGELFGPPDAGGPSSFALVDGADEAYDVRLALAATARSAIDVQTYLWHEDASGSLLLERLVEAADRGVRVRILIDGFRIEDDELDRVLDGHPNVEIRTFNPTLHRTGLWKDFELVEHLERFDHRMHDKLFVADGVVALFGGRNVGDEYFGLGDAFDFRDFDLLAAGGVVGELHASFDDFWNSEWTTVISDQDAPADPERLAAARERLGCLHAGDARLDRRRALDAGGWLAALRRARAHMTPAQASVLADSPHLERAGATGQMARGFDRALADAGGDVLVVTAYLVPDAELLEVARAHVASGGRVRILTNSLVTTNQPLAHAAYQKKRRALLEAGIELWELRPFAWSHVRHRSPGSTGAFLALHAKSAVFGDDHLLVGSMNLDPRSRTLNTELGVLIESRELAMRVRRALERELTPRNAWRVELDDDGRLTWTSVDGTTHREPAPSPGSRLRSWLLSWLPIGGET